MDVIRCAVTRNPVGTDTRMIGHPCTCDPCRASAELDRLRAEIERLEGDVARLQGILAFIDTATRHQANIRYQMRQTGTGEER